MKENAKIKHLPSAGYRGIITVVTEIRRIIKAETKKKKQKIIDFYVLYKNILSISELVSDNVLCPCGCDVKTYL